MNKKVSSESVIKEIRRNYYLGQLRIHWYLKRYHGIQISAGGVHSVLKSYNQSLACPIQLCHCLS